MDNISIQMREEARALILRLLGRVPQYMDCRPSMRGDLVIIVDTQFSVVEGKRRLFVDLAEGTVEVGND